MKKVLIVLLSVLLALSFISCEKDKSGEVIQNYEDFVKSCTARAYIDSIFGDYIYYNGDEETGEVDIDFSETDKEDIKSMLSEDYYSRYIIKMLNLDVNRIAIDSIESASGKLQGTWMNYTASDIIIRFKYTAYVNVYGNSGTKSEKATTDEPVVGELKINMKYSDSGIDENGIETYNISSLSLQGVSYKDVTYSEAYKKTSGGGYLRDKITSATVGGAEVELRLINDEYTF